MTSLLHPHVFVVMRWDWNLFHVQSVDNKHKTGIVSRQFLQTKILRICFQIYRTTTHRPPVSPVVFMEKQNICNLSFDRNISCQVRWCYLLAILRMRFAPEVNMTMSNKQPNWVVVSPVFWMLTFQPAISVFWREICFFSFCHVELRYEEIWRWWTCASTFLEPVVCIWNHYCVTQKGEKKETSCMVRWGFLNKKGSAENSILKWFISVRHFIETSFFSRMFFSWFNLTLTKTPSRV